MEIVKVYFGVVTLFVELSGEASREKLEHLQGQLLAKGCQAVRLLQHTEDSDLHLLESDWLEVPAILELPVGARVWSFRLVTG